MQGQAIHSPSQRGEIVPEPPQQGELTDQSQAFRWGTGGYIERAPPVGEPVLGNVSGPVEESGR